MLIPEGPFICSQRHLQFQTSEELSRYRISVRLALLARIWHISI